MNQSISSRLSLRESAESLARQWELMHDATADGMERTLANFTLIDACVAFINQLNWLAWSELYDVFALGWHIMGLNVGFAKRNHGDCFAKIHLNLPINLKDLNHKLRHVSDPQKQIYFSSQGQIDAKKLFAEDWFTFPCSTMDKYSLDVNLLLMTTVLCAVQYEKMVEPLKFQEFQANLPKAKWNEML